MARWLGRDRWGPVAVAVAAVLAANLVVAALGLGGGGDADPDPPGWLVGSVWVALFACMGGAYAALDRAPAATRGQRAALVGLGLLCLAYPFYTGGFEARGVALGWTVVTFVYAAALTASAARSSRFAALLMVPLLLWLVFAAVILI